ncbi:MAG: hypothetical protein JWN03_4473 [Nocardia sp.]|uniref:hypothetical protein n=1 Tax=Nocardia sp. TaxID=1821 RepID=UPI002636484E|nr:hypothetical protein [Nocardia sp.]MCU1644198.1 hypothetical protein [Nocardia sp.]
MRVTLFESSGPVQRDRPDTNTVARLDEVESFEELLAVLDELRSVHSPARILCTLDDVDQCLYTSMHASEDDRLWFEEGEAEDEDAVARQRVDNARIAHLSERLQDGALRVEWEALPGTRIGGKEDVSGLVTLNRVPDRALDDVVLIQRVPVATDDLAITGIPNGYFADDWDIFQNHAVVRRLATHGYRHFGMGAAFLAFDRRTIPSETEAQAVITDLVHLYGAPESPEWPELAALLTGQRLLILGYTEDFADTLDA